MTNIYCFHGCGQNTEIFKSLMSSLQKNLKTHNWVYLRGKFYKDGGWVGTLTKIIHPRYGIMI